MKRKTRALGGNWKKLLGVESNEEWERIKKILRELAESPEDIEEISYDESDCKNDVEQNNKGAQ